MRSRLDRSGAPALRGARYVALTLAVALGTWLLVGTANYIAFSTGFVRFGFVDLLRHQEAKLATLERLDTLFVGDSALGNGIDAEAFARETGRPAVNLALTGAYGLGGDLNMLRRTLERVRPRVVYLMHTPDLMARDVSQLGYLATAPNKWRAAFETGDSVFRLFFSSDATAATWSAVRARLIGKRDVRVTITDDYVAQRPPLTAAELASLRQRLDRQPGGIQAGHAADLARIARTCREAGLRCVYVHGPVFDAMCRFRPYLDASLDLASAAGLEVERRSPVCLTDAEVGDELDHVRPEHKLAVTRRYIELLAGGQNRK